MKLRFVLVDHPTRGRMILMSTDLSLDPVKIIEIYGYRFKIEVSFKQAVHVIGTYRYHFWMMGMVPLKRKTGNQYLHKKSEKYRLDVIRKMKAYHIFVRLGCVAQGILMHLAINYSQTVWDSFPSWLRTMNKNLPPSELVVSMTLRSRLPAFLHSRKHDEWKEFVSERMDPAMAPGWNLSNVA